MSIIIDSNGAIIDTQIANFERMRDEILNDIDSNLSFESNTVAGVFTNLIAFIERQLSEAVLNTRNQLNPLFATGIALDNLTIFYPDVKRKAATYTIQNIAITTTLNNVSLIGLDTSPDGNNAFTVSDVNGNKYFLQTGVIIATAGVNSYSFRAENTGATFSALNTITNINTPINGLASVNNPTTAITQGINEETDPSLLARILIARASKQKDITRIELALLELNNIATVRVYQNRATTTQNGIPANHIYVIVEGGNATEIATTINNEAPAGIPLFGSQAVNIIENDLPIVINYDIVVVVNFYAVLNIKVALNAIVSQTLLKEYIVTNFISKIGKNVLSGDLVYLTEQYLQDNGGVLSGSLSLDNITFVNELNVPNLKTRFAITTSNITVNII